MSNVIPFPDSYDGALDGRWAEMSEPHDIVVDNVRGAQ